MYDLINIIGFMYFNYFSSLIFSSDRDHEDPFHDVPYNYYYYFDYCCYYYYNYYVNCSCFDCYYCDYSCCYDYYRSCLYHVDYNLITNSRLSMLVLCLEQSG